MGWPDAGVAEARGEVAVVVPGAEADDLVVAEAEVAEALGVVGRTGEDGLEGLVEGAHDLGAGDGGGAVVEEAVDVGGEVGVVDADDGDAEEFGREHADAADGAGGGDVDDIGLLLVGEAEHLEDGGQGEFEVLVLGHLHGEDGVEVDDVGQVLGMSKRVEETTVRSRPVSWACLAAFWMKRQTPLTSARVSVNFMTRSGR